MNSLRTSLVLALVSLALVSGTPVPSDQFCVGKTSLGHTFIGKNGNVKVDHVNCTNAPAPTNSPKMLAMAVPFDNTNVCGAKCDTNCFNPSGGGPDPNDCSVIADALLYDGQNTGALFPFPPTSAKNPAILMTYKSCETFIVNQASESLTYCRNDWATLVNYIAKNCQSTQNAHGGNCVASDQRWFIQWVQIN